VHRGGRRPRRGRFGFSGRRRALALIPCLILALAIPGTGLAANQYTLDPNPESQPHVTWDQSGNVFVAWNTTSATPGGADTPMVCEFAYGSKCTTPVALQLPGPGTGGEMDTVADFPVVITSPAGSTSVYVFGPRYVDGDLVVWQLQGSRWAYIGTVSNGFGQSNADAVLPQGSNVLIGSWNPGVGFDSTPFSPGSAPGPAFVFSNPGPGGVEGASLGVDQSGNPVDAYWNLTNPPSMDYYYYNGNGGPDSQANWTGPVSLGTGQMPSLASGPHGLYLLSADGSNSSIPDDPTSVDIRSYSPSTHTFGPPLKLLSNPTAGFDEGGGISESHSGGQLAAVWPALQPGGAGVLEAFSSSTGASFSAPYPVATIASAYAGQASVALKPSGTPTIGIVAFNDSAGLEVADLSALPPPPPVPGKSVDAAPVSGVVLVKQPGHKGFIRLRAGQRIPLGSTVDATSGVVSLLAARDRHRHTARGQAHGGVFRVKQKKVSGSELTVLALVGRKPTACPARTATVARPKRHRALWIRDPGYFIGLGLHASVRDRSTRGADWLTEDTCRGTLVRVKTGAVLVHDFPHHRTFVLRAGHQFLVHSGKGG
jgi:hypothetical protein